MKHLKLLLTAALTVLGMSGQAKDYQYETVAGDLMKTRIYRLDNGLTVYLSANPEQPRIQTYIAVRTGSKNDPAETTGLAHYLEHLMFKGTRQFGTTNPEAEQPLLDEIEARYEKYRTLTDPEERRQAYHEIDSVSQLAAQYNIPNEYDKLMAAIGAEGTNAYTSNDVTCYTEDIPSNEIENWAKIQADRFQNMVIRGFHTELEAVYEEYNIGLSSDSRKLFQAFSAMLWPTHPYGTQTTIGTQDHLKNPSIVNIKNYFNKWYVPNNVAICMSGDMDMDKTIEIIDKYFSSWKPGKDVSQPTFAPLPPLTSPKDTTVIGQEAEQIWLGWRAKQANSLQADTLELMEDVLSNGRAGLFDLDLNQTMKVQRANGGCELLRDLGGFIVMGTPKEGQTLDEVKTLLLGELDKLKKGDFPEELLPAIINNRKNTYYLSLESNASRADKFVDAFINEVDWAQEVGKIDRISKITKQEIVDFANRFFTDGYIAVYKKQGIDTLQKKIDKPQITPIPANRDLMSQFVKDIQESKVEPIQPRFVDFKKDLTISKTKKGLPLYYVKTDENGRFTINFRWTFGQSADNRYNVAADYLRFLGTDKLSAEQLRQKFYELACDYHLTVGWQTTDIWVSGLSENMEPALALLDNVLQNVQVDKEAYQNLIDRTVKSRNDNKKNQRVYFNALYNYGTYGERNAQRDIMSEQQMRDTDPQVLVDLIRNLTGFEHEVYYSGSLSEKQVNDIVTRHHTTPKKLRPVLTNNLYVQQPATKDEILLAPYDAKNIYMRMYHNEGRDWNPDESATVSLFNEYFGGGMNGIVFQELREARGLAYNAFALYNRPSLKGQKESYFTHIITQNDKMMDCIKEFHNILNELPASETAFQIAKDGLTKTLASQRTTKMDIIFAYWSARLRGIDYDLAQKIYESLPALQLQDIVDFEKANMANKHYRYIILGDEKNLDIEALEKIAPIRRLTTEEVFGY